MAVLSDEAIARYAYRAGFRGSELSQAVAVALAESGGDPTRLGDTGLTNGTWGPSVGLWQIRSLNADRGSGGQRDERANRQPATNAKHAYQIAHSSGWRAWTTYQTGAYRPYLHRARMAAHAVTRHGGTPAPQPKSAGCTVVFDLAELDRLHSLCDTGRLRVEHSRRVVADVQADLSLPARRHGLDPARAAGLTVLFGQLTGEYGLPMVARHIDFDTRLVARIRELARAADGGDHRYGHADLVRFLRRAGTNRKRLPEAAVIEMLRAGGPRHRPTHPTTPHPPAAKRMKAGDIVPAALSRYRNGKVPSTKLATIDGRHRLWSGAAKAYRRMAQAARVDGVSLTVNSAYRTHAEQAALYQRYLNHQGNLAAPPGSSNHGWGLSADINTAGSLDWLRRNASRYGFFNDVPSESWHWTYRPA
ncbi:MAG TPA: D-alanyl-D-alanine carboxypeptidase family protein [Actinocatenispora sp.]